MERKRKIIFCDNTLWGLVNFRGRIIRHFVERGDEVLLVAPKEDNFLRPAAPPAGARYVPIKLNRCSRNPIDDLAYAWRLYRLYRRERPDYIFHYTVKPNVYGAMAARMAGIPCTDVVPGLGYGMGCKNLSGRIVTMLYKIGFRCALRVFVLNVDNRNFLARHRFCPPGKLHLLSGGEGVDLSAFSCVPETTDAPVSFVMVGRVLYDKGYQEFIDAARQVKKDYPQVNFGILGALDPTYPAHVAQATIERDTADGAVEYWGAVDDVRPVIGRPGVVVVLPSYYNEGLNRSLMEACSMGRPVLTTDIAGCREVVDEGKNGFLVPPRRADALADAMRRYLQLTAEERARFSAHSRQKAQQTFDINYVVDAYEAHLEKAADVLRTLKEKTDAC